ncbi:coiled-coil domain-containing protein 34-like [Copidosoma floridanum]|uniref:coiled-coil domain-containing protein 34-like n=1 Tax=Copidosoma floridanum TaxID=29053 RepID=UPI0006C9CCB7|nr:coiled-coil domain-containing protein 34-like [Copidosoma floridanum]
MAGEGRAGLTRSYSEHANLVLQHFQQHRRHREPARHTRSGPDFRAAEARNDEADDEDDERGGSSWRVSGSSAEGPFRQRALEIGAGDSSALGSDLSRLSLTERSSGCPDSTHSFNEFRSDDEECEPFSFVDDDDNENFRLIGSDTEPPDPRYALWLIFSNTQMNNGATRRRYEQEVVLASPLSGEEDEFEVESEASVQRSTEGGGGGRRRINGRQLDRNISYENWAQKKQLELQRRKDEARRAEEKRRRAEEQERREREEKERREVECIVDWRRRKEREKMVKRALLEKELELQKKINEIEETTRAAKDVCLKKWYKRKDEMIKAMEREEFTKRKKAEEEKLSRLQMSLKAYEEWREKAKNTPRPATQGLLPHQKAKPAFTNPNPWLPLVDNASEDSDTGGGADALSKTKAQSSLAGRRSKRSVVK